MSSYRCYQVQTFTSEYAACAEYPQVHDDDNEYEKSFIMDLFGSYSPLLILPPEVLPKRQTLTTTNSDDLANTTHQFPNRSKSQKKRQRKQRHTGAKICNEKIEEQIKIDLIRNFAMELDNKDDFVASSCCGGEHCHHYAYAYPSSQSYIAFVDNFLNGMVPGLFVKLQLMYTEMHTSIKREPFRLVKIRKLVDMYENTLKLWRLRMLNCIKCLIDLISHLSYLHDDVLQKFATKTLRDTAAIDFFFDVDTVLVQLVMGGDHDFDIAETESEKPIENFIYQSLHRCFVTYLRGVYLHITHLTGNTFPGHIHDEILAGSGNMRRRVLHLGKLADAIILFRENRQ